MVDLPVVFSAFFCVLVFFSRSSKKIIFFTWLASLSIASKHLCYGVDFIGLGLVFESSLFAYVLFLITQGERAADKNKKQGLKIFFSVTLVLILSGSLFWVVYEKSGLDFFVKNAESVSLGELSKQLLAGHFLSVETLLVLAFLVLVGLGLNLRKESRS